MCVYILYVFYLQGDVYFYYGLENYYQNHRRYVKSRSDAQLLGAPTTGADDCAPFVSPNVTGNPLYAPCGAVANSMFNGNDIFIAHFFVYLLDRL